MKTKPQYPFNWIATLNVEDVYCLHIGIFCLDDWGSFVRGAIHILPHVNDHVGHSLSTWLLYGDHTQWCSGLPPGSAQGCWGVAGCGSHKWCQELNPGCPYTRQLTYLLDSLALCGFPLFPDFYLERKGEGWQCSFSVCLGDTCVLCFDHDLPSISASYGSA